MERRLIRIQSRGSHSYGKGWKAHFYSTGRELRRGKVNSPRLPGNGIPPRRDRWLEIASRPENGIRGSNAAGAPRRDNIATRLISEQFRPAPRTCLKVCGRLSLRPIHQLGRRPGGWTMPTSEDYRQVANRSAQLAIGCSAPSVAQALLALGLEYMALAARLGEPAAMRQDPAGFGD
jgi:hypothetical protein